MKKRYHGFTLLEMIVVVLIISILFLLTIPNVAKVMDSVETVGCDALTKVVDAAIIEFKLDYDEYPSSVNDLINGGYITSDQATCSNGKAITISDGHAYAQ